MIGYTCLLEVGTGPGPLSRVHPPLHLSLLFLLDSIQKLLHIVLVFEGVTKHVEVWRFPPPLEALLRGIIYIIIKHFAADGGQSLPPSHHVVRILGISYALALRFRHAWRVGMTALWWFMVGSAIVDDLFDICEGALGRFERRGLLSGLIGGRVGDGGSWVNTLVWVVGVLQICFILQLIHQLYLVLGCDRGRQLLALGLVGRVEGWDSVGVTAGDRGRGILIVMLLLILY